MSVNRKMPVLTKKWIEALRSGKYNQTKGCLRNDDGMCCLGVAADIMRKDPWYKKPNEIGNYPLKDRNGETGIIPDNDFNKLVNVYIRDNFSNVSSSSLAELNDNHNFTFPMIADVIESWWTDNPIDPENVKHRKEVIKKYTTSSEVK